MATTDLGKRRIISSVTRRASSSTRPCGGRCGLRRRRFLTAVTALVAVLAGTVLPMKPGRAEPVEPAVASREQAIAKIDADLRHLLENTPADEMVTVIVHLDDQVNLTGLLSQFDGNVDEVTVRKEMVESLKEHATQQQLTLRVQSLLWALDGKLARITPYWIFNGMAVTATPEVIWAIAAHDEVASIEHNETFESTGRAVLSAPRNWGVDQIGATTAQQRGYNGRGVVIAALDSGADIDGTTGSAPSNIAPTYRGGTNSWFDPYRSTTRPYDPTGHGTAVLSIMAGVANDVAPAGVAPGARWIAAKIFDDRGRASTEAVHAAFQWVLDPDGNPSTSDGADIVNNSWGSGNAACSFEFAADIAALQAAGVMVVFSAGNSGPATSTGMSPANLSGVFSVGAVDDTGAIWPGSSRGPSSCSGTTETFPDVTAPGVDIVAQTALGQTASHSGTSFAAPFVSGAAALLLQLHPGISPVELADLLRSTAVDLGPAGTDDTFGAGRIDVDAALKAPVGVGGLKGFTWFDANDDGAIGDTEFGAADVAVTLSRVGRDRLPRTADDVVVATQRTALAGTYSFAALESGQYVVEIDPASVPTGSSLAGPAWQVVDIEPASVTRADFAIDPGPTATVTGSVAVDIDGDGTADTAVSVAVLRLIRPGADGLFATVDDLVVARTATDAETGAFRFEDVVMGRYRVAIDRTSLADGTELASSSFQELVAGPNQIVVLEPFVVSQNVWRANIVYFSTRQGGTLDDGTPFHDEDVLVRFGESLDIFFDGSDVGLETNDLDALTIVDASTILFSLDRPMTIPGLGDVSDSDVIRFTGTFGRDTVGTLSIYLRGSAIGLTGPAGDIDALALRADGSLAFSVVGNPSLPGIARLRDEDIVVVTVVDGVPGELRVIFDGSAAGLPDRAADIDALSSDAIGLVFSTLGDSAIDGHPFTDGDLLRCDGAAERCPISAYRSQADLGLSGQDVDALHIPELRRA